VTLVVGPEGGLSEEEEDLACAHGALMLAMGRRILRTETAGLAALAALNAAGELQSPADPTCRSAGLPPKRAGPPHLEVQNGAGLTNCLIDKLRRCSHDILPRGNFRRKAASRLTFSSHRSA
jgi:hypothetical protein